MVAVDDTRPSEWAVQLAASLAKDTGASVGLVHVISTDAALTPEFALVREDLDAERRRDGQALLDKAAKLLPGGADHVMMLKEGEPIRQIVAAAKEWDADLIVIGTHGRRAVAHFLLGSTAEAVVRHSPCPVLTVGHDPAKPACGCSCSETSESMEPAHA